jgi:two-component system response regulator MtrA
VRFWAGVKGGTQMTQILIADDDKDLIEGLRWYLEAEGFQVAAALNGIEALEKFRELHPELVILDIMMPGLDGVQLCEIIRNESEALIMMLSARDGEIDKVRALTKGADDYLTKPFYSTELVARIQALLRRVQRQSAPARKLTWMELEIFFDERQVTVKGKAVPLTTMEFDLLSTLIKRPRIVFTRDQLIDRLWGETFVAEPRLVDNFVYKLREKLTKAGMENCPIATVRGVGYAFRPEE